ncbi:MAG: prepilin-type N-terminal cleavage/methylation domain-containing protein [Phycisphaerales bacterium]
MNPVTQQRSNAVTQTAPGSPHSVTPSLRLCVTVRRAFSMIEMLIAFLISSLLLSACLVALDSSFKAYEVTTESASTHVVSRLVMTRVMAMVRQGEEFGPYPVGILQPTQMESPHIEFVSFRDDAAGIRHVTRLEKMEDPQAPGTYQLQYRRWDYSGGTLTNSFSYPLIRNLKEATFTLEYDVGPVLRRATVDMTIKPNDVSVAQATQLHSDLEAPTIRLISSASPRKLD